MRPTVGVAPGTFTLALGGLPTLPGAPCPPDSTGWYMLSPFGQNPMNFPPGEAIPGPLGPIQAAGGRVAIRSPYANEVALNGLGTPRTVAGIRLDIFGPVIGGVVLAGVLIGLLASK